MSDQTEPSDAQADQQTPDQTAGKSDAPPSERSEPSKRKTYWLMPVIVVVIAVVALIVIWADPVRMRQIKHILTFGTFGLSTSALILWFVFFAPVSLIWRLVALALPMALVVAALATLRIEGSSGDLVPIVSWRWTVKHDRQLASPIPEVTVRPDADLKGLADYPQLLGPDRNGVLNAPDLQTDWKVDQPRELWRIEVGDGWSAFAVRDFRAVTQEQRGNEEWTVCYDIRTSAILWAHGDKARFTERESLGGIGPRATPTLTHSRVYAAGATGILNCLDLKTGKKIWSRNILADSGRSGPNEYGMAGSPLLFDSLLVINAGGSDGKSLLAYNADNGKLIWSAGSDMASYSSPLLADLAGRKQIVIFNQSSIAGHDPATGKVLWETPWKGSAPKAAQPLVIAPDKLFVTSSYGVGCAMYQLQADTKSKQDPPDLSVSVLWKNLRMKSKFSNTVYRDGHIYGLDDGMLSCVDAKQGRRIWKGGRYGHGQIILINDLLLIQSEYGYIALVSATPDDFEELTRFQVLATKTWNHATLAGRYLLVRNNRQAVCLELPVKQPEAPDESTSAPAPEASDAKTDSSDP